MDAQDIIELIEYFRNLQDTEMKFEIEELRGYIDIRFEELYDKLTEYIDFNRADSNHPCRFKSPIIKGAEIQTSLLPS